MAKECLLDSFRSANTLRPCQSEAIEEALPPAVIEHKIYLLCWQKVMLDSDLAALYGVETKQINRAVRRNLERFPSDLMFQLTPSEARALRFPIGTSSEGAHGGRCYLARRIRHRKAALSARGSARMCLMGRSVFPFACGAQKTPIVACFAFAEPILHRT